MVSDIESSLSYWYKHGKLRGVRAPHDTVYELRSCRQDRILHGSAYFLNQQHNFDWADGVLTGTLFGFGKSGRLLHQRT